MVKQAGRHEQPERRARVAGVTRRAGIMYFAGHLSEEDQQLIWATKVAPPDASRPELFNQVA